MSGLRLQHPRTRLQSEQLFLSTRSTFVERYNPRHKFLTRTMSSTMGLMVSMATSLDLKHFDSISSRASRSIVASSHLHRLQMTELPSAQHQYKVCAPCNHINFLSDELRQRGDSKDLHLVLCVSSTRQNNHPASPPSPTRCENPIRVSLMQKELTDTSLPAECRPQDYMLTHLQSSLSPGFHVCNVALPSKQSSALSFGSSAQYSFSDESTHFLLSLQITLQDS